MEQLSLLPKVYEYGESLSSEEMNQIVQHLNSSIEAINYLLAKNNGINDGHCEMRYKVSAQQPEAPAVGSDGKSNGWSDTYTKPDTDNGEITWMTLCFLNGDGVYGAWSNPVCITWGSIEGQRGRQGEAGVKGSFKSRVFKRQNSRPDTPTGGTYDNPIPPEGGWTDGIPQGNTIIWSSVCTFHGDGTSSGWSAPAPESDSDTLDVEFSPLTIQPSVPIGDIPFANHESEGWYDSNSVNFESAGTMIWRAERKVSNGEYNGEWTITRIYGEKGEKGDPGNVGGHYEFRYRNYIPSEQYPTPSKPAIGSNGTTDGWSETQQTLSETDIKNGSATWMTQCYVNEEGVYGEWTLPIRITGANGLDGEDGIDGKNGTVIEFVYALKTSVWSDPTPPPTTQVDDWSGITSDGTVWTDNPQGVSENAMYEYISQRSKNNDVWSAYSIPVIWSKWGEKGMDGDGVQYVFKLFSSELTDAQCTSNIPTKPDTMTNNEWIPSGWSDNPISPTSSNPFCYCSVIKRINGVWGNFEKLSLWSKYSKDGNDSTVPGPDGKGITYIITRDTYSESDWAREAAIENTNNFSRGSSDLGSSCRAGDFFIVKGTATDGTHKFHQATFRCTDFTSSLIYGTCVSHIKDGDAGASITGKTGPMFYIAGIWDSNTEYTKNDYKCPVVMLASNNKYYYLKDSSSRGQNPSSSDAWGEADNFAAVFTKVLFSEFAKLGSFVINQDWMLSQHGVEYDSNGGLTMVTGDNTTNYQNFKTSNPTTNLSGQVNFCPNLAIDAKTGKVYAQRMEIGGSSVFKGMVYALGGTFSGTVNANNGTFKGNVEANTLIAGDPNGINIRTSSDKIEFCQGADVRAYFVADGNGMQLHVWDANGTEYTIDFTKWSQVGGSTYTPVRGYYKYNGSQSNPFISDTDLFKGSDGKYYSYSGSSYTLISSRDVYVQESANAYPSHGTGFNGSGAPIIYAYATNSGTPCVISLIVNRYVKYSISNGVMGSADTSYIYHSPDYPVSPIFSGTSIDMNSTSFGGRFVNPQGGSANVRFAYVNGVTKDLGASMQSRTYVSIANAGTAYPTNPTVYDVALMSQM